MIKIAVGGDFCPQGRVEKLFCKNDFQSVLEEAKDLFSQVDYCILNLEEPIITKPVIAIRKNGPSLRTGIESVLALNYLGVKLVTLANNHLKDYGKDGIITTISECKKRGIDCVGAGENIFEASKIYYKKIQETKIAVINCCEHEFSIASQFSSGCNPLNLVQQYRAIVEAKKVVDCVIVIVHGGCEHYPLPTPRMKEWYHFFVDVGADVVINHHQHCYSGYEMYKGKPIVYGLGNFCFDKVSRENSAWNIGYILILHIAKQGNVNIEIKPYNQCGKFPRITFLSDKDHEIFEQNIMSLNNIISNDNELLYRYKQYVNKSSILCQYVFESYSTRLTRGLFLRGFLPKLMSKEKYYYLYDMLFCESHIEKLKEYLNNKIHGADGYE